MRATIVDHRVYLDCQEVEISTGLSLEEADALGFERGAEDGHVVLRFGPVLAGEDAPLTGDGKVERDMQSPRRLTAAEQQTQAAVEALRSVEAALAATQTDGKSAKGTVGKTLAELEG